MRKSMKKLIALTLACLMLATLFVGCGKKDDGGSSGGDTIKLGWMARSPATRPPTAPAKARPSR